jgi:WD40 repeat protein
LELDSPAYFSTFSPDQQKVAVATDRTTTIFEIASDKDICRLNVEGKPNVLAFSPDNNWLAVGTSKTTGVFDAASGKNLWLLSRDTRSMAYTRGGNRLAAANESGNVRVFDPKTGKDIPGAIFLRRAQLGI